MSRFVNSSMVSGNVTREPRVRQITTGSGKQMAVADYTIAVNPRTTNENAKADFINVTLFGTLADIAVKYVTKGDCLGVLGELNTGVYEDKHGTKQYPVSVIGDDIKFGRYYQHQENDQKLVGRLTRDPELTYASSTGNAVCKFTVAVNRRPKKDEQNTQADFFNVVVFGKRAEFASQYLKKGMEVGVRGRIHTGSYTNDKGFDVYTTEIVAHAVDFAEKANKEQQDGQGQQPQQGQQGYPNQGGQPPVYPNQGMQPPVQPNQGYQQGYPNAPAGNGGYQAPNQGFQNAPQQPHIPPVPGTQQGQPYQGQPSQGQPMPQQGNQQGQPQQGQQSQTQAQNNVAPPPAPNANQAAPANQGGQAPAQGYDPIQPFADNADDVLPF